MTPQLPSGWRELLDTCDISAARNLIVEMFTREAAAARKRGEELWLEPVFLASLQHFAAAASPSTAAALVER